MDTPLLKRSFRAVALTAMQAAQIAPMVHATCHAHPETERPSLPHPHSPHSIPPTHTHTHVPIMFLSPGAGPSLQVELCSLLPVNRLREQVSVPAWLIPRKGRAGERHLPSICTTKTRMVIKNNQSGHVILKQKKDTGLKLKKSIPRVRQVGLSEQQLPEQEGAHLCVHLGHGCSALLTCLWSPLCCFCRQSRNPGPDWLRMAQHFEEHVQSYFLFVVSCLVCSAFDSFGLFYF